MGEVVDGLEEVAIEIQLAQLEDVAKALDDADLRG